MQQKLRNLAALARHNALRAAGAAGSLVVATGVQAQTLPAGVETAIDNASDMLVAGATAVIVAMVAFWALRKLGSKMGWW
jgi:hypothetical protein